MAAASPDTGDEIDLAKLNALARSVLEAVAAFMGAEHGKARLEFEFVNGNLERGYRHVGPIPGTALGGG